MLFKFGKFWKSALFMVLSWSIYALFGYEFALVTIVALIYCQKFKDNDSML